MGAALLVAAVLCAAMLVPAIADASQPAGSRFYASATWQVEGFTMTIENGADESFSVQFQADCNLVLNHNDQAYWATGTNHSGPYICYLVMGRDGNLVIYGDKKVLWESNSSQLNGSNYYAQIQLDGNLVIYNEAGSPVWATQTNWW